VEKIKEGNHFRLCWVVKLSADRNLSNNDSGTPPCLPSCMRSGSSCANLRNYSSVCVQPRSSAVNMSLPAFAAERRCCWRLAPAAVDRRSAANPPYAAATVERWDRDGRTDTRPFRKPLSTYCPGCVSSDCSSGLWFRFVC